MTCRGCNGNRGLGQIHAADGAAFLRCLLAELGLSASGKWNRDAHTALYTRAAERIDLRGDRAAETVRLTAFGANPQEAANFAANLPMGFPADSSFWTCLGIGKSSAVSSMASKSGSYWNAAVGAGYTIAMAEGGMPKAGRRRGSLVASLLTLAVGTGGLMWLGD